VSAPPDRILSLLRSPRSGRRLELRGGQLVSDDEQEHYPLVRGIPILIDDRASAFSIKDFEAVAADAGGLGRRMRRLAEKLVPSISTNMAAHRSYRGLAASLADAAGGRQPRVLVIGGSVSGVGFEELSSVPGIELVETDVAFGPRTDLICDGHSLPFADESFDAVVCQAVLEHVADPARVVAEIWRVLMPKGLVYSDVPFMQQVHEGAYDFTRFTLVGHRRLYRRFEVLDAGATGGPGMSLAWSVVYFARALAGNHPFLRDLLAALARFLTFWLKYLDPILVRHQAGIDGASGTFLLARKSDQVLSDRALVREAGGEEGGYEIRRV
jgi:SAM-dependent methyltransferase